MKRVKIFFIGFLALFVFPAAAFPKWPGECTKILYRITGGPFTNNNSYGFQITVGWGIYPDSGVAYYIMGHHVGLDPWYRYQVGSFYFENGSWKAAGAIINKHASLAPPPFEKVDWDLFSFSHNLPPQCGGSNDPAKNLGPPCPAY